MPRNSPRLKLAYLVVALLAGVLAAMLWSDRASHSVLERADRITLDLQTQWRGKIAPATNLLIVSVDDATLARLNAPAPDRALLAQGIDRLAAAGARVVALDMLLLDPSRVGPVSDQLLAESMRRAGNVMIPFALPEEAGPHGEVTPTLLANAYMRTKGDAAAPLLERELQPSRVVMPIAPLAEAALALGHVSARKGLDGALRFDLPGLVFEGEVYPTLALRIAARARGLDWQQAQIHFGERVTLGELVVPLDLQSRQWLNYYGPKGTFETISFLDLIDDRIPDARLAGRVVIVGTAALASGDVVPTPFDASLPGYERLATVTDNILGGRVLARPAWADSVELLAALLLPLLAVALIATLRLGHALGLLALLVAAMVATLQTLFVQRYLLLAPAFPLLGLALATLGALVLRGGAESARRRAALDALLQSEERYALALRGANDGMWDWDIAAGKVFYSARWLGLMSLDLAQASGMAAWTSQLDPPQRQAFDEALADHLAGRSQQFHHVLNFRQGGAERWLLARGIATRDNAGTPTRMAGSLTDISQQQQLQRQITFDALHDRLTGLPNRAAFLERLGQAFAGSGDTPPATGVVLVDIDGFRALNESEGTTAADAVLYELGRRLRSRDGQALNVARLGADRFSLLFSAPLVAGGVDEGRLAAWVLSQFKEPFRMGERQVHLNGSVGWSHTAQGPATADELLGAAEMALAHAKAHRRGHVHAYDPAEQLVENSRRWLKENIDLAIKREEFRLHYQPLVRLSDRQLLGFEALVRWPHPSKGMVMPGDFIPFAEESGQILDIGRWTLLEAARQLVKWDAEGFTGEIAVNLSGAQFSEGDLEADARAVLSILGDLSPRRIKLEVTESMAMSNPQLTAMALQSLATLGFKISIDDFGTGYSSLAYLHRFPFDTLKIDRSFVMRLASGREAVEIVRTIVGLALALDKQVLAEGVEDETQARMLQELGVHVGQGWLFAKALPEEQARALIGAGPVGAKA